MRWEVSYRSTARDDRGGKLRVLPTGPRWMVYATGELMAAAKKVKQHQQPASGIANRRAVARGGDNPAYRQRRAEILQAAAPVFKSKGLAGANLGDIAGRGGV